jgi:mono/diheme cytochrome c family protein
MVLKPMEEQAMNHRFRTRASALLAGLTLGMTGMGALAATPTEMLATYTAQGGGSASAARGQEFFTSKHGKDWSCSSCHTSNPTSEGKHAATGKLISPLAPAANAERFTDTAKTEKWFRRNCNDVMGRECSAAEKADVMAWLMSIKK